MKNTTRLVVTDYIEENLEWEAEQLAAIGIDFQAYQLKSKPQSEVLEKVRDADIVLVNMVPIDEDMVAGMERCKLVLRHGIGYDNVNVEACTKKGIQAANQVDYCKIDVAEHAVALLLACGRKITWSRETLERSSKAGAWNFSGLFPIRRLEGKTVGIIGLGRIGSRACRKLIGLGFKVIACDPFLEEEQFQQLGAEQVDLTTLLQQSDYVTIHAPLNPDTREMINRQTLELMKPTACLINTSRGGVVDEQALAEALKSRRIASAAIDVYVKEPPPADHPFFSLDNIILTPHTGWASEEAGWEIRESIMDDVRRFIAGQPPKNLLNPEVLNKG